MQLVLGFIIALALTNGLEAAQSLDFKQAKNKLLYNSKSHLVIKVAWELNSSASLGSKIASISESYDESWIYQQDPQGGASLSSPRAKVDVYPLDAPPLNGGLAQLVAIDQIQLSKLLGLEPGLNDYNRFYWLDLQTDSTSTQISIVGKERVHTVTINVIR